MRASLLLLPIALSGCIFNPRPVSVPQTKEAVVVVGSAALGGGLEDLARHPWIAMREKDGRRWERWEVMCCPDSTPMGTVEKTNIGPTSDHGGGGGKVMLHGIWQGREAERIIACVRDKGPRYPYRHEYQAWPGPNSNTFVDYMMRTCDMHAQLPSTSIGRDFRGLFGLSATSRGTGFQIESPLLGIKLGLTEGIEFHMLGLVIGFDWWPPALIVPFGDGRLGFEDE